MNTDVDKPRASVIVEWENALHAEADRATGMLRELRSQMDAMAAAVALLDAAPLFELIVVYDEAEVAGDALARSIEAGVGPCDATLSWRLLPIRDGSYYRNKDLGARSAVSDVLVFLDSDVVPEPGWLERLLGSLDDPAVRIVAGSAYIEPSGLVGKAFALTWFFPLRSADGPLRQVTQFFANNLAERREFYLEHPFPDLKGTSRGACLVLARAFARAGIAVYQQPCARVRHPAPNGFGHISRRALAQGRDRLYRERNFGTRGAASWLAACWRWVRHVGGSTIRVLRDYRKVGLNPLLVPAAIAVAGYYYTLYWLGETLTHLRVPAIQHIRI